MDFRTYVNRGQTKQSFAVRAAALILKDGKVFLTRDHQGIYYTIGGAIEVGEATEDAVIREVKEELGISIKVEQLAFIIESDFCYQGTRFHYLEFLYLVTPLAELEDFLSENGDMQVCEWVDLTELDKIDLRPEKLKAALPQWQGELKHIVSFTDL